MSLAGTRKLERCSAAGEGSINIPEPPRILLLLLLLLLPLIPWMPPLLLRVTGIVDVDRRRRVLRR